MATDTETASAPIRLVAGLGNPGSRYEATRHNVGFMVLDRLVDGFPDSWKDEKRWETLIIRHGDICYLKPQTFMNASGKAIAAVAKFYKIDPAEVLIVYDDADLPLGRLRFRASGSAGGHNGIKSIISCLGGDSFPRLKVGIGRQETQGPGIVGHVLGKFGSEEEETLEKSLQNAVSAIESALTRGLDTAMNEFNRREKPKKPKPKAKPTNQDIEKPNADEAPVAETDSGDSPASQSKEDE